MGTPISSHVNTITNPRPSPVTGPLGGRVGPPGVVGLILPPPPVTGSLIGPVGPPGVVGTSPVPRPPVKGPPLGGIVGPVGVVGLTGPVGPPIIGPLSGHHSLHSSSVT
jgi:hypothetical protein